MSTYPYPATLQVNAVSVTSSHFPNRETFVERDEFCILVEKLIRTCKSKGKYYVLVKFYPEICEYIWNIKVGQKPRTIKTLHQNKFFSQTTTEKDPNRAAMCKDNKWSPDKMGYKEKDPR